MIAIIGDMKKDSDELYVLGSNPLNDLMQMKDVPAERLPDEHIGDMPCQVYRVKDTAFMGCKVPWVKLWLDPESKLPVQIHSVVMDRQAMTLNDFHWNEPFDKGLFTLEVPKGYKLVESPESEASSQADIAPLSDAADPNESGHQIPAEEIAKTLDMLRQRIEANYKAIKSWSGTFDAKEHFRHTHPNNPQYETISHSEVQFFAEPDRHLIRINNRAVEPTKVISDGNMGPGRELPESLFVRTPEELLRFFSDERKKRVKGFPRLESPKGDKGFRVLYREPPKAAGQYIFQGYINPLSFFDGKRTCKIVAEALRGEHGPDPMGYMKRNVVLRVRSKGAGKEYVLTQRFKPIEAGNVWEYVFSSEADFNLVSLESRAKEQLAQSKQYKFREEKGVFIPYEVEYKMYEDRSSKDSKRLPTQHRVYTLKQTLVNEPIDPAVFEIKSMGLQDGDRMVDLIENQMHCVRLQAV